MAMNDYGEIIRNSTPMPELEPEKEELPVDSPQEHLRKRTELYLEGIKHDWEMECLRIGARYDKEEERLSSYCEQKKKALNRKLTEKKFGFFSSGLTNEQKEAIAQQIKDVDAEYDREYKKLESAMLAELQEATDRRDQKCIDLIKQYEKESANL